ncbi:MAG TPA: hypothetical protein VFN16_10255 [Saccharospirillum sp.]|nr:hypothetical protein [Saccharospirillum sp.]
MKPTESETTPSHRNTVDAPPPGIGRRVLVGGLWLVSVGFWLWAGIQLGQLIAALWF